MHALTSIASLLALVRVALTAPSPRPTSLRDVDRDDAGDVGGTPAGGERGALGSSAAVRTRVPLPVHENPKPLLSIVATDPLRLARRTAAVVLILEGLRELLDPLRRGDGDSYRGGGLLLLPHERGCWFHRDGRSCTCPVSGALEAQRLLAQMPKRMRFHLTGWFVDVEQRGRWTWSKRRRKLVRHELRVRRPGAERARAIEGVGWLAERWGLRDARGELVEPWLVAPGLDRVRAA